MVKHEWFLSPNSVPKLRIHVSFKTTTHLEKYWDYFFIKDSCQLQAHVSFMPASVEHFVSGPRGKHLCQVARSEERRVGKECRL